MLLPSVLTWRAGGAPGPWDARQHCVHGGRGQLRVCICGKGRAARDLGGRAGGAGGLELRSPGARMGMPGPAGPHCSPGEQTSLLPRLERSTQKPNQRAGAAPWAPFKAQTPS